MEKIEVELSKDEALILFECLAQLDERDALPAKDQAEEKVFWTIQAQLESKLVEPFDPEYRVLVERAKARLSNEQQD